MKAILLGVNTALNKVFSNSESLHGLTGMSHYYFLVFFRQLTIL